MEKKTDLRIVKTHKALTDAFLKLLGEKRFEEITVNELCERALVRRATFYKHFADKYEFFTFIIRSIQKQFDEQNWSYRNYEQPKFFYIEIINRAFDFLSENETLVQKVLDSNMLPTLLDILSEQITFDITQKLKEDAKNGVVLPAAPQIMAPFFTGALIQTLRWWFTQKNRLSEAELIEELTSLLNNF